MGLLSDCRGRVRRAQNPFYGNILHLQQSVESLTQPFCRIGFKQIHRGHIFLVPPCRWLKACAGKVSESCTKYVPDAGLLRYPGAGTGS